MMWTGSGVGTTEQESAKSTGLVIITTGHAGNYDRSSSIATKAWCVVPPPKTIFKVGVLLDPHPWRKNNLAKVHGQYTVPG